MTLIIPAQIHQALLSHALRERPLEACGILAGVIDNGLYRVAAYYPMNNTDKSAISFFMEPQEQISVFKDIRGKGRELVGVFHSHPHSQAYPSAKDVSMAYYPEALYVILSLEKEEHPHMRAFSIVEGEIKEAEIKMQPMANSQ